MQPPPSLFPVVWGRVSVVRARIMATSSSSSSPLSGASGIMDSLEAEVEYGGGVMCDCPGAYRAKLFSTRKSGTNYGRRFYGCKNWDKKDRSRPSCNICKWVDGKYPPRTAEVIVDLKWQRDELEREREEFWLLGNELKMKLREECSLNCVLRKDICKMRIMVSRLKMFGCLLVVVVVVLVLVLVVLLS